MGRLLCRTCLYGNENMYEFRTVGKVLNILQQILPEIKITLSENALVCIQCYYFLKNVENFKAKCIDAQRKLVNYNVELYCNTSANTECFSPNFMSSSSGINTEIPIPMPIQTCTSTRYDEGNRTSEVNTVGHIPSYQNYKYSSLGINTEVKQIQTCTSTRIDEVYKNTEVDKVELLTSKRHYKPPPEKKTSHTKKEVIQTIEVIEINDNEVELKIAEYPDSGSEDADDIFVEKNDNVIVKEEVKEDNPSFFNIRSKEGFYSCKLCEKKYKTSKRLYEHTQTKHTELKFFHCYLCNFFTLWKSALNHHMSLFHSTSKMEKANNKRKHEVIFLHCYHCSFKSVSKNVLENHLQDVHFGPSVIKYGK